MRTGRLSPKHSFYLVQRLTAHSTPNPARGFDGFFALEYMGSAEFEFDAPSRALKDIRSGVPLEVRPADITFDGCTRTVWFVAAPDGFDTKLADFELWLAEGLVAKEHTSFPEKFRRDADDWRNTNAWWAFDAEIAWALDERTADLLRTAFLTKKTG